MGHRQPSLLGRKRFRELLEALDENRVLPDVVASLLKATTKEFETISDSPSLRDALWLLTRMSMAARGDDFHQELRNIGIAVENTATVHDIAHALGRALEDTSNRSGRDFELAELTRRAAVETFIFHVGGDSNRLFEATPQDVQLALKEYSKPRNYSLLCQEFFGRCVERFTKYFLSCELPKRIGKDQFFANFDAASAYDKELKTYSRQVSRIVEHFAQDWYSKTLFEGEFGKKKIGSFAYVAMLKIRMEMERRESA